jgi:hypothetical protein
MNTARTDQDRPVRIFFTPKTNQAGRVGISDGDEPDGSHCQRVQFEAIREALAVECPCPLHYRAETGFTAGVFAPSITVSPELSTFDACAASRINVQRVVTKNVEAGSGEAIDLLPTTLGGGRYSDPATRAEPAIDKARGRNGIELCGGLPYRRHKFHPSECFPV